MLDPYPARYLVAGGWALDLFAGRVRREHSDVDVLIRRDDVKPFARTFAEYSPKVKDQSTGEHVDWRPDIELVTGRHTLTISSETTPPIDVLLADSAGTDWVFHRGGRIRRQWRLITLYTGDGLPFLAPEIVLLLKARDMRPKDDADFTEIVPLLDRERLTWLRPRLSSPKRPDHPWRPILDKLLDERNA
ncbi:Amino acid transporter [Stackebrandtia soli]